MGSPSFSFSRSFIRLFFEKMLVYANWLAANRLLQLNG